MSDDAHGIGVVGSGRGSTFAGTAADVPLQMGTLSKAIGGYGGYLCASAPVIDLIKNRARTFVYSTGLPPAIVAAAIAALDLIEPIPRFARAPLAKARAFTRRANLPQAKSPIVPLVVGDAEAALAAARRSRPRASWWCRSGRRRCRRAPRACALPSPRSTRRPRHRAPRRPRAHPAGGRGMTALFVTATGTDVGKTFVAAG